MAAYCILPTYCIFTIVFLFFLFLFFFFNFFVYFLLFFVFVLLLFCFYFYVFLILIFLFFLLAPLRDSLSAPLPLPFCMLDQSGGGILQFMDNDVTIGWRHNQITIYWPIRWLHIVFYQQRSETVGKYNIDCSFCGRRIQSPAARSYQKHCLDLHVCQAGY